jgi:hypothetical protein
MRQCDVCEKKHYAKGFCKIHYERVTRRPGGPEARRDHTAARLPLAERMAYWTDKSGDCWLWTGALDRDGYGRVTVNGQGGKMAHRIAYELAVGPIPEGLTLDHSVCGVTRCVNPAHMEPVTNAENARRARV